MLHQLHLIIKGIVEWIIVKIELFRFFVQQFFHFFVSVLMDVNEFDEDLNLNALIALKRNINVLGVFKHSFFLVIITNFKRMWRQECLVALQFGWRYFRFRYINLQIQ
jgi:hypothetical protein